MEGTRYALFRAHLAIPSAKNWSHGQTWDVITQVTYDAGTHWLMNLVLDPRVVIYKNGAC